MFLAAGVLALRSRTLPNEQLVLSGSTESTAEHPGLGAAGLGAAGLLATAWHGRRDGAVARRPRARRDLADASPGPPRRRRLRIRVDVTALYEHGAHPSVCHAAGETYTHGLPSGGDAACTSDVLEHCSGACRAEDVVNRADADHFAALIRRVLDDFQFLDIEGADDDDAPLHLEAGVGFHSNWYREHRGIPNTVECARDCRLLNGWTAPPALCDGQGLNNTDILVAIIATARVPGVAASAGPCAQAADDRPVVGVLNWHQPLPSASTPLEVLVAQHAGLLRHELFHALGFLFTKFRAANVLVPRVYTDADGSTQLAWAFKPATRAAEALRQHVNCTDPGLELPLMVEPAAGAHSHWPTRLLHDEVMSYGAAKAVSYITLAAMSDLGLGYLPNYDRAECLLFAREQGCAFVTSRCSIARHDRSVRVSGPAACRGLSSWPDHDAHVERSCAFGSDVCRDGYDASTGLCDAQCATDASRNHETCLANVSWAFHAGAGQERNGTAWWVVQALFLTYSVWALVVVGLYNTDLQVSSYKPTSVAL